MSNKNQEVQISDIYNMIKTLQEELSKNPTVNHIRRIQSALDTISNSEEAINIKKQLIQFEKNAKLSEDYLKNITSNHR